MIIILIEIRNEGMGEQAHEADFEGARGNFGGEPECLVAAPLPSGLCAVVYGNKTAVKWTV